MFVVIMLAIAIAIWGFLAWHVKHTNRKIRGNFEALAAKFGLRPDASGKVGVTVHPSVAGVYRGRETQVATLLWPRRRRALTRVTVARTKLAPPSFEICWNSRLRRRPDRSYLETGDSGFDQQVLVASSDPARFLRVLNAETRAKLQGFLRERRDGEFVGTDEALRYDEDLIIHTDAKRLRIESIVDFLHDLAGALEGEGPGT